MQLLLEHSCCNSVVVCSWLSNEVLGDTASLCSVQVQYKSAVLTAVSNFFVIVEMPRNAFNDEPCTLVCQMFFNGFEVIQGRI